MRGVRNDKNFIKRRQKNNVTKTELCVSLASSASSSNGMWQMRYMLIDAKWGLIEGKW